MRNARGPPMEGENERQCKTTAKKCTEKLCCTCNVAFLLITQIVVFSPFFGVAFAA